MLLLFQLYSLTFSLAFLKHKVNRNTTMELNFPLSSRKVENIYLGMKIEVSKCVCVCVGGGGGGGGREGGCFYNVAGSSSRSCLQSLSLQRGKFNKTNIYII